MDFEDEWEFLPDPRFLDFPEDPEKKIFSGKRRSSYPTSVFDTNYFTCPSSTESRKIIDTSAGKLAKQFVPVPIQLGPTILKGREEDADDDDDEVNLRMTKEVIKKPVDVRFVPSAITEKINGSDMGSINETDQDAVSQVFFKKFVDMKTLDSPKSPRNINIIPQVDQSANSMENMNPCSPPRKMKNKNSSSMDFDANKDHHQDDQISWEEQNNLGMNLWKWGLSGIGAICSFGVAAATICIIIFGSQQRNNKHQQQNQKIRFQIYPEDKRSIKQVVQQATKMNEKISAVRGVPVTRAHITYGGYYDSL